MNTCKRGEWAMAVLPPDYKDRVYAGWLGKCIGVRYGAPLEGWTYDEIRDNLGELDGYLNEAPGKIFKPDDDTAMPMILIRALEDTALKDGGSGRDLTAQQIGDTWLNYLGDQQGTLWWGGYGISTEHTAYLNLVNGVPAPQSGSIAQNGAALAEQIGGQIFSDIWGLVTPNDPALAADLAERAASVSHDGAGIDGGRFIAALTSHAFSEFDPVKLIEKGLELVPADGEFARVTRAMLDFYREHPADWHACYAHLKENFGYDRYPGMVHIIPNAGVVALSLLYGAGDFSRTIQICNMAGWDTDCNVGNVGAIMGVAVGVTGIEWRWREPMNDLLIAASIIGTRNILTIPQCADLFCRLGQQIAGEATIAAPRYHFRYPGSTSNFWAEGGRGRVIEIRQSTQIDPNGTLQASIRKLNKKGEIRLYTRTYYRPGELSGNYYGATFTPLIHPGQTISAEVYIPADAPATIQASLYVYDENHDKNHQAIGQMLIPGEWQTITFTVPALTGACLSKVGIVLRTTGPNWNVGALHVRSLDWNGPADYSMDFTQERAEGYCISQWTQLRGYWRLEADHHYHGSGLGLNETYTGDLAWKDYTVTVRLVPEVGDYHNVNVRVQGALRSYAVGLGPNGQAVLYRKAGQDYTPVQTVDFPWQHGETYTVTITALGDHLQAAIQGGTQEAVLSWHDPAPYLTGQVGLSTWHNSHTCYTTFQVQPVGAS